MTPVEKEKPLVENIVLPIKLPLPHKIIDEDNFITVDDLEVQDSLESYRSK